MGVGQRCHAGSMAVDAAQSEVSSPWRLVSMAHAGLCGLATAVSLLRAFRTDDASGVVIGLLAASFALLALIVGFRSRRLAVAPLAVALLMEFTVMINRVAPPRIVNAIPLLFALGLAVAPAELVPFGTVGSHSGLHRLVTLVSLGLMVPMGVAYLIFPNLVAPAPDIYVGYVLYAALVASTVTLARRGSWWIAAMPFVSIGLFLLLVQAGVHLRGWSG